MIDRDDNAEIQRLTNLVINDDFTLRQIRDYVAMMVSFLTESPAYSRGLTADPDERWHHVFPAVRKVLLREAKNEVNDSAVAMWLVALAS
jgi:hypothetical protein